MKKPWIGDQRACTWRSKRQPHLAFFAEIIDVYSVSVNLSTLSIEYR